MTRGLALVIVGLMQVMDISLVLQLPSSHGVHSGSQLATFLAGLAAEKVKISERMMVGDIWGRVIGRSLGSACRLSQIV
jgi:hypothetical protein